MDSTNQPTKEQIREWLNQRSAKREPLPEMEQIQRQLGWKLFEKNREPHQT